MLSRRVEGIGPLVCSKRDAKVRVVAFLAEPCVIQTILAHRSWSPRPGLGTVHTPKVFPMTGPARPDTVRE